MTNTIVYLIAVSSVFSLLYLLYRVLLEKLTFHAGNRLVLVLLLPVSLLIPFSNHLFPAITASIIEVPLFNPINFDTFSTQWQGMEQPLVASSLNFTTLLISIYWIVFSFFVVRLIATVRQLVVLRRNGTIQQKKGYQLVISKVPEVFSYFHWVFIPKHNTEPYDPQILAHEKAHIQLKHSWDVVLAEVYIAFFWFNPLLYFYRSSLKAVHEFQADKAVLQNGVKTSHYLQLLLQSLEGSTPNNLYNYFNQTILKKRLTMMTKPNSNRLATLKYLLFAPICALLISAFTSLPNENMNPQNSSAVLEFRSDPPSLFPVQHASKNDISAYYAAQSKRLKAKSTVAHNGIDIKAKIGTAVVATADGIISKAALEGDWGNLIVITHSDGYETWYAHLSGFNTSTNKNVKKGDIIGYVGNTGRSSGPHLHYEVKQHGKHQNPLDFIK